MIENIPQELCQSASWIVWREVTRGNQITKVPYNPRTGQRAETDDPTTWGTLAEAAQAFKGGSYSGVGFVRTGDYVFVDIDGCVDPETGEITPPWARKIIAALTGRAYIEKSPSLHGIHCIARGKLPPGRRQWDAPDAAHTGFAFYDRSRYFTMTGAVLPESGPIADVSIELTKLHAELFETNGHSNGIAGRATPSFSLRDSELLDRARRAVNGTKFERLWNGDWGDYPSQSEADSALCCVLAFWTGRDIGRIDRLFRQSGLMRPKWLRDDYRASTIAAACAMTSEVWKQPQNGNQHRPIPEPSAAALPEPDLRCQPYTDTGNAERLVALHGRDLRFCTESKKWLVWDGRRWNAEHGRRVKVLAKRTIRKLYDQAADIENKDVRQAAERHARNSESAKAINAMLACAEYEEGMPVSAGELDQNRYLLNCRNGTLDLADGCLRKHARENLITKLVHFDYRPGAKCPRFIQFLHRIMDGGPHASDDSLARSNRLVGYLQKCFGYALTADVSEKAVFCFFGSGNNGKTTLLEIIRFVLAEYSTQVLIDSLMVHHSRESNASLADLADLRGARFVTTSEAEEGQRLAVGKLKYLTQGMGTIKTCRKYENPIHFPATHKLFLDANHKPVIRGAEKAVCNRLKLVPFTVIIPTEEMTRVPGQTQG